MALIVTKGPKLKFGSYYVREVKVVWDSSYAADGESLTPADMGFEDNASELIVAQLAKGGSSSKFVVVSYDGENEKLLAFGQSPSVSDAGIPLDEIAASEDLSSVPVYLLVYGRQPTNDDH